MKKYFMQGTADELHEGDRIKLDVTENLFDGRIKHHHIDCAFLKPLIPLLLEQGIIEEQEVKDKVTEKTKEEIFNFCDKEEDGIIEAILKHNEELEKRVERLENIVSDMAKLIRLSSAKSANSVKHKKNAEKMHR